MSKELINVPKQLLLFRHGQSMYLSDKEKKAQDPNYILLKTGLGQDPVPSNIQALARRIDRDYPPQISDDDTPLDNSAFRVLRSAGSVLANRYNDGQIELPDIIFVSPTLRTRQTFQLMVNGFSALLLAINQQKIPVIEDIRIREKTVGNLGLHSDRISYFGANPDVLAESRRLGFKASFLQRFPGGGQNIPDKMAQMRDWDEFLSSECRGKNVWAFTHHLAILSYRLVKEGYFGHEGESVIKRFKELDHQETPPPGSLTTYRFVATNALYPKVGGLQLQRANEILLSSD